VQLLTTILVQICKRYISSSKLINRNHMHIMSSLLPSWLMGQWQTLAKPTNKLKVVITNGHEVHNFCRKNIWFNNYNTQKMLAIVQYNFNYRIVKFANIRYQQKRVFGCHNMVYISCMRRGAINLSWPSQHTERAASLVLVCVKIRWCSGLCILMKFDFFHCIKLYNDVELVFINLYYNVKYIRMLLVLK